MDYVQLEMKKKVCNQYHIFLVYNNLVNKKGKDCCWEWSLVGGGPILVSLCVSLVD